MPILSGNNMKTISPVSVWWNGAPHNATVLALTCSNDNLFNQASFNYNLFTENEGGYIQLSVAQGYLSMTGEDYEGWATNDYAYNWAATHLNLTITGNYAPPDPTPPPPPPSPDPGSSGSSGTSGEAP